MSALREKLDEIKESVADMPRGLTYMFGACVLAFVGLSALTVSLPWVPVMAATYVAATYVGCTLGNVFVNAVAGNFREAAKAPLNVAIAYGSAFYQNGRQLKQDVTSLVKKAGSWMKKLKAEAPREASPAAPARGLASEISALETMAPSTPAFNGVSGPQAGDDRAATPAATSKIKPISL